MDHDGLALAQARALEDVAPDGEDGFGDACGLDHRDPFGDGDADLGLDDGLGGAGPTGDQRHHPVAGCETVDAVADLDDLACQFQPQHIGDAGGRGIIALALHGIGAVDARGMDPHAHLARAGTRQGAGNDLQHFGAAGAAGHQRHDGMFRHQGFPRGSAGP